VLQPCTYAWRRARACRAAQRPGVPCIATEHSPTRCGEGGQGGARPAASPQPPPRDRVWHGADMTAMTHSVHQVLETKDFQAAAKVIENLFTIDIPQNEETGPEERVWSAPAVSLASRVCSSASVCVVCVCVWVGVRARAAWRGTDCERVAVRCSGQICSARECAVWAMSCSKSNITRKTATSSRSSRNKMLNDNI